MNVTDEMVERACQSAQGVFWTPDADYHRNVTYYETARADMRRALAAALSVPTTPPPNTRRVRIAVACRPDNPNYWEGCGIKHAMTEADAWELLELNMGSSQRLAIVEADIPLPAVPTVRGRVE